MGAAIWTAPRCCGVFEILIFIPLSDEISIESTLDSSSISTSFFTYRRSIIVFSGKREAGRGKRRSAPRMPVRSGSWRCSCDFQKFSGEISQNLGAAGGEMDIVLDANSSPTRTVNPRLDRHHGA